MLLHYVPVLWVRGSTPFEKLLRDYFQQKARMHNFSDSTVKYMCYVSQSIVIYNIYIIPR